MELRNYELLLYPSDAAESPRRITACTVNYNAMQIPDAIVRVAVGNPIGLPGRTPDNRIPVDWLDPLRKLRIAFRRKAYAARTGRERVEEKVIFEGYPNAPAIEVGVRSGEISLNLQHWLRDLTTGSMLHEYAYPFSPEARRLEILYPVTPTVPQQPGRPPASAGMGSVGFRLGLPLDWRNSLPNDVWANGLKSILSLLATRPFQGQFFNQVNCGQQMNQVSPATADALQRIQGPSHILGRPYTEGGGPLLVRQDESGSINNVITFAIATMIGEQPLEAYQASTFWDHMLRVFSNLFLDIIPRPTDALVVPFVPTPGGFYSTQILEDTIQHLSWAETKQINIRGTMVIAPTPSAAGLPDANASQGRTVGAANSSTSQIAAGCYVDTDDPRYGRIHPLSSPEWLSNLLMFSDTSGLVVGQRRGDPANGGAGPAQTTREPLSVGSVFDRYAQLRYVEEALRHRRAVVMTALRTDICVGSTVAVSARTDAIGENVGSDTTTIIGRVTGSSHQIDRTAGAATSQFSLSYVTTLKELEEQRYVVDEHPIFNSRFLGAPLV